MRAENPFHFISLFEDELRMVRERGEPEAVERQPDWHNPQRVAAEIEALAAVRALAYWGTNKGLCLKRHDKPQGLAA